MKQIRFLLMMSLMLLAAVNVQANDFLEIQDHYTVMATSPGVLHFKVPVYSRGGYNYYVSSNSQGNSRFYYKKSSSDSEHTLFYIDADRAGVNANDDISYGKVDVQAGTDEGIIEITNINTGSRVVVPNDGSSHTYYVTKKKEAENDQDYVTWLEVDWYMPEKLDSIEFGVYADIKISKKVTGNVNYEKSFTFKTFRGADAMMTPQLYDPFFYATKESSVSGYGYAAVPYVLYYDPKSYTTTLTGSTSYPTDKRSDNIFVQTTDTLQPGFKANFNVYRMKTPSVVMANQTTNAVTIPAYHRIYDFVVKEEKDSFETFTGNNVLTWSIKNPHVTDLVEGDYFEIQRALKSDFSDAQTVDVVSMERGLDKSTYEFVDKNRDSWTGNNNNVQYLDTLRHDYYNRIQDYTLYDANGNPMCVLNFSAYAKVAYLPSVPVYYRIRRASASMWGWKGHDFAKDTVCMKHNFLAPLSGTQPAYTLDAESHKVDFRIRLANADVQAISIREEDVDLSRISVLSHNPSDTTVMIGINSVKALSGWARAILRDETETNILEQFDISPGTYKLYKMPKNGVLQILGGIGSSVTTSTKYQLTYDFTIVVENYTNGMTKYPTSWRYNDIYDDMAQALTPDELARLNEIMPQLKQEVGQRMAQYLNENIGKCMWDKSARLVLIKTTDGVKQEYIIPQDSIRRLSDGNWEAHYTDLANHACTNYSYAVRIDQSSADLHVSDSAFLLPKVIFGPNLYFEEGASIKSFTASNLADDGEMKRGILLRWEPTNAAVDSYILTRLNIQRGTKTDTVYTGVDNSYFDTIGVIPVDEYKYTVKAVYDCNGRHTEHEAVATGVRSPYGEIRGQILMPDNSGMAGVTVTLQNELGNIVKSVVTGPDGRVVFDKLDYNYQQGSDYTIIPSSQYGTFSFNNTSAGSATVRLSINNCIARDIDFVNTAITRLSGRALYKGSTIPVAGAMFLLNGDTIRRNGAPLTTGIDGNFELTLTKGQPYTLQIIKQGHTFEGEGFLRVEDGQESFALTQSLDGVRFYDQTKVRLVGRVAGGNDQRDLPEAFGLGRNNLGDDLQLVLELEGDNVSHLVDDPNDPTRDTVQQTFDHLVYTTDPLSAVPSRTVGSTSMRMEKKRIIIRPDSATGEYAVDLYPVKYKVTQATAKGYATLFAAGQGSEVFDLTNASLTNYNPKRGTDSVHYNAVYDRIYHTPVKIHMQQLLYGLAQDGYGEKSMKVSSFNQRSNDEIILYNGPADYVVYTMGYPIFCNNRKYQFEAQAYEDYRYNNSPDGALDRVPQRGGSVTIHNGMEGATKHYTYPLDSVGKNRNIYLTVDQLETEFSGTDALHTVSAALEVEGNTVETEVFRAFISGDLIKENELRATDAAITILDIVRDPGGDGSSAWVESGATYNYNYTTSFDFEVGVTLAPTWGTNVSSHVGVLQSAPGGYTGTSMNTHKEFSLDIPISREWSNTTKTSYTFTTNQKISTSSSKNKQGIGANADVFLGATTSVLTGKAKSVSVINDTMYHQHLPAIQAGTMRVLAQGTDAVGKPYYLVVGEKIVLGSTISNTFVYTQYHIWNTVIPRLFLERNNLLEYFGNEAAAQQAANQRGEEVYWYRDSTTAIQLNDTLAADTYVMVKPQNDDRVYSDRVQALDNIIAKWMMVLYNNEKEKITARYTGTQVGTYSVSAGTTYNHSDSYSSTFNYSEMPNNFGTSSAEGAVDAASKVVNKLVTGPLSSLLKSSSFPSIKSLLKTITDMSRADKRNLSNATTTLGNESGASRFAFKISPILDLDLNSRNGQEVTNKKSTGFTIVPDNQGEITVAVYRAPIDSVWNATANTSISTLPAYTVDDNKKYGSYVFFTQAGSTYCPYEDEDETKFYNPGTPLNNSTMLLAKPAMS
ncbi:MAG: carboxypeptidase regulatory-like domain-containing protein, partial [Paludibacteraceae bacterium]|nr:carboxypeptidase regulatory-like domain-containing protein [Paludibacteraceae bacterium]